MSRPTSIQSWHELTAILLARLSILWLLLLTALALPNDNAAFYTFMGIAVVVTIPYSLWLRSRLHAGPLTPLQFMVDFILIAGLIHFTGGLYSALTLLYPVVILAACIVSSSTQAVKITVLGILAYIMSTLFLSRNMPVSGLPAGQTAGLPSLFTTLILRAGIFALFGVAGIYISKCCTYSPRNRRDTRNTMQSLLDKLSDNMLMLDRDGRIIAANPAACQLLQSPADKLTGRMFTELCVEGFRPAPEYCSPFAWIQRTAAPPVPVTFRRTDIELPASEIPDRPEAEASAEVTLLVLSDCSRIMKLERELQQARHTVAAARIAGEMAHDIRTPLTTISASIQLLQHFEKNAATTDWLPNSPRKKDRKELFDHILGASEKMDTAIRNFVDFAEYDPADLLSIIKLDSLSQNKGYIGHLNTREKGFKHGQNSDRG